MVPVLEQAVIICNFTWQHSMHCFSASFESNVSLCPNCYGRTVITWFSFERWQWQNGAGNISSFIPFPNVLSTNGAHQKLMRLYRDGGIYLNEEITGSAGMLFVCFFTCLIACNMNSGLPAGFLAVFEQLITFKLWSFWPLAVLREFVQEEKKNANLANNSLAKT